MHRRRSPLRRWAAVAILFVPLAATASVQSELAFHRGVAAYGRGELDAARAQFEKVIGEEPNDGAALHYLALIAQDQKRSDDAIALYQRAIAIEPDSPDLLMDLGTALLDAGRAAEARTAFDRVIALQPERARAYYFAGIASYRDQKYDDAIQSLDRAEDLDPSLRVQARYYVGLSEAFRGDLGRAAGTLSDVEEQSPQSPLGRSAAELASRVRQSEKRRWSLSTTLGGEWDSNSTVAGEGTSKVAQFRGIARVRGSYRFIDEERFNLTGGYDGYASAHEKNGEVDLLTNVVWGSVGSSAGNWGFNLRTDGSYSLIDHLSHQLRWLVRVTPSITYREGSWGLTQVYFQYEWSDLVRPVSTPAFDRDGNEYTPAITQFFFPHWGPLRYVRIGGRADFFRPDGSEFDYDGGEGNFGFGLTLPLGIDGSVLYRYIYRNFRNTTVVTPPEKQNVHWQRISVDLARKLTDHIEISASGSISLHQSNVGPFDYNRYIAGTYLTYYF